MMDITQDDGKHNYRMKLFKHFWTYREGRQYTASNEPSLPLRGNPPDVIIPGMAQGALPWVPTTRDTLDIDTIAEQFVPPRYLPAYHAVRRLKLHFRLRYPELKYRKCLGWGGNGLAASFDVINARGEKERSIVVKMLFSDNALLSRHETNNLWNLRKAEHIVQLLYHDQGSANDKAQIVNPLLYGSLELIHPEEARKPPPNVFVTEMLENGDLAGLLSMVRQHRNHFPNAVLWRFCLCFIRMCIALAYPPASFPENENHPGPITETVPEGLKNAPKRMVHFDFDPRNIFIGQIQQGTEHNLTPLLKLGDFGLATVVEPGKDDFYYEKLRYYAKKGFYAPEQFCVDWDYIPRDQNAIQMQPLAGNYGAHTNVWAVGYLMECLITLSYPAQPPKPTRTSRLPPHGKSEYYTYAGHLEQEYYAHVDREMIYLVQRLQAHLPADRPSLHELEEYVTTMVAKQGTGGYTEQDLLQWMQKIFYEPPPGQPEDFRMMPVAREVMGIRLQHGQ